MIPDSTSRAQLQGNLDLGSLGRHTNAQRVSELVIGTEKGSPSSAAISLVDPLETGDAVFLTDTLLILSRRRISVCPARRAYSCSGPPVAYCAPVLASGLYRSYKL